MTRSPGAHPRLYFDGAELQRLRAGHGTGHHSLIWKNIAIDAARYAAIEPATDWIAPLTDDPNYENLYDRFWAMMSDAAIVEQLAFAAAYGGENSMITAATTHLLAASHRWQQEQSLRPDYGTAYATTRLLKAIAIGYDLLAGELDDNTRLVVREMLVGCTTRLADEWFNRPDVRGPVGVEPGLHSPHHSSVEWSAFGIVGLSLLGEVDAAADWTAATTQHFIDHLLPAALAADGSHPEGNAFWASTVVSQLQYLDPLRRCTGKDLLGPATHSMSTAIAQASFRPDREVTGAGEPIYGDSTAVSALLLCMARELQNDALQRLAMTDPSTGRMETWPARTPRRGEQMHIAPGGYAYAWLDADLPPGDYPSVRSWHFPIANESFLRSGWTSDDALIAVRDGKISIYFGARLVFEDLTPRRVVDLELSRHAGTGIYTLDPPDLLVHVDRIVDTDCVTSLSCCGPSGETVATVRFDRAEHRIVIDRTDGYLRSWVFDPAGEAELTVVAGSVQSTSPSHHGIDFRAGYGLLDVVETDPRSYPTMTARPTAGHLTIAISRLNTQPGDHEPR